MNIQLHLLFLLCSQAKATYEVAVEQGHTVATLDEFRTAQDIFRMKIGNIPPKTDVIIKLAYVQVKGPSNVLVQPSKLVLY